MTILSDEAMQRLRSIVLPGEIAERYGSLQENLDAIALRFHGQPNTEATRAHTESEYQRARDYWREKSVNELSYEVCANCGYNLTCDGKCTHCHGCTRCNERALGHKPGEKCLGNALTWSAEEQSKHREQISQHAHTTPYDDVRDELRYLLGLVNKLEDEIEEMKTAQREQSEYE